MSEILCPTCGRPNPEEQSFCDFCGSPIKDQKAGFQDQSSIRDNLFAADRSPEPEPEDESSRLDSLFSEPEADPRSPFNLPSDQDPPFPELSRLDEILPPINSPEPDPREELLSKTEPSDTSELDFSAPEQSQEFPDFDLDDLLGSDDQGVGPLSPDPLGGSMDWEDQPAGMGLSGDSWLETPFPGSAEEEPDFNIDDLFGSGIAEDETQPDQISPVADQPAEVDSPEDDWFDSLDQGEEESSQDPTAAPDPFSLDGFPDYDDDPPPAEELQPDPDLPDQEPPPQTIGTSELWNDIESGSEPTNFEEDSGWLDMLQDPDSREDSSPDGMAGLDDKKPQTDWLDKIKRLNKSAELVEEDSSFPDWLTVSEKPAEEEPVPDSPPADEDSEPASSGLPAWLQLDEDDDSLNEFLKKKDLLNGEYKPKFVTDNLPDDVVLPPSYSAPEPDEDEDQAGKFPSWAQEKADPEDIPENLQFLAGVDPDSLPQKIVDPFQGEDDYLDDLFDDELPEWLTTASTEEETQPFEQAISLGELPGWVEAMRPVVESDTSGSSDDDYIENYGPLAGIPSVLPAEADILQDPEKESRKPLDLIANKTHQENVHLLKKLIGDETKTDPILKAAPVQTQRVLRWLLAIILVVTTAGTIIFGGTFQNPTRPEGYSPNTGYGALYAEIEKLQEGQPVLIAFDYQPASAGELHTAAAGVVDHLMTQGTYLIFLSTEPTGPALAEYFLDTTQAEHDYQHTRQYINLGYLPGESAGLLSFIVAPQKIIPLAFDGSNAWGSPPLAEVNSIQDFAMILVLSDDPNTAKNWIEQVGTILTHTPLTMVISAQVEPLIQPYFRSFPQLLNGYVSGVIDSVNYESLIGRPNLAHDRWLPFNIGIIVSVSVIFIGGLANGVLSLFSRHRTRQIGEN